MTKPRDKKYLCEKCGKRYNRIDSFKKHLYKCTGEKFEEEEESVVLNNLVKPEIQVPDNTQSYDDFPEFGDDEEQNVLKATEFLLSEPPISEPQETIEETQRSEYSSNLLNKTAWTGFQIVNNVVEQNFYYMKSLNKKISTEKSDYMDLFDKIAQKHQIKFLNNVEPEIEFAIKYTGDLFGVYMENLVKLPKEPKKIETKEPKKIETKQSTIKPVIEQKNSSVNMNEYADLYKT